MASWNNPTLHSAGDTLALSDWNNLANDATFLYQAPYANYYNSVSTTLTNGAAVAITLGGTTTTGYGMSVSGGNSILLPLTGRYWVSGAVNCNLPGATPSYLASITVGGVETLRGVQGGTPGALAIGAPTGSGIITGTGGSTTVGMTFFQNSGSPSSSATGASLTYLSAFFVGSA